MTAADQSNGLRMRRTDMMEDQRSAAAARASSMMRAKSPAASASLGATHEPPTASTFGQAR